MMYFKKLLIVLLIGSPGILLAQWDSFSMSFDDSNHLNRLFIDTLSNPNNIWQVGSPKKSVFSNAKFGDKCIVTDSVNAYPPNDTSSFIVKQIVSIDYKITVHVIGVSGYYQVNSTNDTDFGYLWFSPDNGQTWVDLINDSIYAAQNCYYWFSAIPVFTGSNGAWQYFGVDVSGFDPVFNIKIGDTLIYKFTFISDSMAESMDGLMFDELLFEEWTEGVEDHQYIPEILITGNPGPGPYSIDLGSIYPNIELNIHDVSGKLLSNASYSNKQRMEVAIDGEPGLYLLRLGLGDLVSTLKVIKE